MRVSVVIPAHNVAPYIEQALRSILPQSLWDFEILLVDDGSTDDTAAIVAGMTDPRIRLIQQQKTGIVGALNHGLDLAMGSLIARLDGDDVMTPGRLAAQVAFLESHPEALACGTDYELFGDMTGRVRSARTAPRTAGPG